MPPELYNQLWNSFHFNIKQAERYKSVRAWEAQIVWKAWLIRKPEKVEFT